MAVVKLLFISLLFLTIQKAHYKFQQNYPHIVCGNRAKSLRNCQKTFRIVRKYALSDGNARAKVL